MRITVAHNRTKATSHTVGRSLVRPAISSTRASRGKTQGRQQNLAGKHANFRTHREDGSVQHAHQRHHRSHRHRHHHRRRPRHARTLDPGLHSPRDPYHPGPRPPDLSLLSQGAARTQLKSKRPRIARLLPRTCYCTTNVSFVVVRKRGRTAVVALADTVIVYVPAWVPVGTVPPPPLELPPPQDVSVIPRTSTTPSSALVPTAAAGSYTLCRSKREPASPAKRPVARSDDPGIPSASDCPPATVARISPWSSRLQSPKRPWLRPPKPSPAKRCKSPLPAPRCKSARRFR